MSQRVLFPTSVVGSLPRPDYVKDLISDDYAGSAEDYRRSMEAAIRSAVALQECAGLDVITDGEWWRKSYIGVIAELSHGFELSRNPADGRPWTIVVDKLSPKNPGFIAREAEFLKSITKRQIKATLPAPALLGERMWDPKLSAKAYLIQLFQWMIERGARFGHSDTPGGYIEVDTQQDFDFARRNWASGGV